LNLTCEGLLLGMQAGGITLKAPSITAHSNLRRYHTDIGPKTGADGTSGITNHEELRIY
jgi:hypothetical protein